MAIPENWLSFLTWIQETERVREGHIRKGGYFDYSTLDTFDLEVGPFQQKIKIRQNLSGLLINIRFRNWWVPLRWKTGEAILSTGINSIYTEWQNWEKIGLMVNQDFKSIPELEVGSLYNSFFHDEYGERTRFTVQTLFTDRSMVSKRIGKDDIIFGDSSTKQFIFCDRNALIKDEYLETLLSEISFGFKFSWQQTFQPTENIYGCSFVETDENGWEIGYRTISEDILTKELQKKYNPCDHYIHLARAGRQPKKNVRFNDHQQFLDLI